MKMNVLRANSNPLPFHFSVEQNKMERNILHSGKNAFIVAPRKVEERLEQFSLCSVNAVLVSVTQV